MAVGASSSLDFKSLDRLAKLADKVLKSTGETTERFKKFSKIKDSFSPLQQAFLDLNINANGAAAGLASISLKTPGLSQMFTLAVKTSKAFDDMRKVIKVVFTPLKTAKAAMGGIFSIVRSIAMTPLNLAGGLIGGLKNAFSSMADFASDKVGSWWQAQTQRTDTRSLLAIQRTEDTYGMNGMLSTLSETFSSSLRDYTKYGGLLSSGLSNEDIGRYRKMDSTEAMLDALGKIRENGIANGYDPNSRSYFDATGMGEAFGISFEQYTKLIEVLPMVTSDLKKFKSMIATNDKMMISTNRTTNQLGVAFDNLKTRLISRFGPALLELAQTVTPIVDKLSKDVFTNDNVKAFSGWLVKLTAQIKDFFADGGMKKLREWLNMFIDAIKATVKGFASFASLFSDDPIWKQIKEAMMSPMEILTNDLQKTFKDMKAGSSTSSAGIRVSSGLSLQMSKLKKQSIDIGTENEAYLKNEIKSIRSNNEKGVIGSIEVVGNKVIYIRTNKKGKAVEKRDLAEIKLDTDNRTAR